MTSIKISKYNNLGKKSGTVELKTQCKDLKFNPDLIHQMITGYLANKRQVLAHTKNRSEVQGSGRKPWRQKGTGRARIGSIRAPHWIGGGIVFGPRKNRNFKQKLPQKMRQIALAITLAKKNDEKEIFAIDKPKINKIRTAEAIKWLQKYPLKQGNILLLLDKSDPILYLSTRNLPYFKNKPAKDINCLDLMQFDNILLTKEAVEKISQILTKKSQFNKVEKIKTESIVKKTVKKIKKSTVKKVINNKDKK